ncbi:Pimeloyl-ACP methyl ester carboxylesterase [Actinacidiphila alni]|uniref:Pimeloyl-ACP methyl ester carboxylesterase n=1 Tax=Actinacidiphila alni TaxID=380248 RepID=A0A1I2LBB9_9ACTN|nr:alpha/beta hydrolase [Actinacidiphila alni]SFF75760.1 Pimeloyl-ACP methyl ester carboxylesterase [Actinacidiphila alni]
MTNTLPTAVLIHGALTDASVWHDVIARLTQQSIPVFAPALPMRSFDGDVAYVRAALDTLDGPLVVAAHSYAGSVISAPAALTEAVRALVFVAAFQPAAGESSGELNGKFPGTQLVPENLMVRRYPGGNEVYLAVDRFAEVYAADVEPTHAAVMAAAQHPFDPATLDGTFAEPATWTNLPSWAVVSTSDVSIPTEALRFMARRAGSTVVEIDSSHAVPVAHPDAVADAIEAAVISLTSR